MRGGKQPGAGRPKGSLSKPRLSDFLTQKQVDDLVKKATQMAKSGDVVMLKFVLEQHFGKAPQAITDADGGSLTIAFDTAFKAYASLSSPNKDSE